MNEILFVIAVKGSLKLCVSVFEISEKALSMTLSGMPIFAKISDNASILIVFVFSWFVLVISSFIAVVKYGNTYFSEITGVVSFATSEAKEIAITIVSRPEIVLTKPRLRPINIDTTRTTITKRSAIIGSESFKF